MHKGTIVRLNPVGLAYTEDTESKCVYSFTFDKIRAYRGESVEELGLKLGSLVHFSVQDGVIHTVQIHSQAVPAAAHSAKH
jgi:hypothetical protein